MKARILTLACLSVLTAAVARAQTSTAPDVTALSLEELLQMKVEVVSSASKFAQEVTDAPASITIVTGDEIRRLGARTLKDVLDGVRGFYTLDDRNYSYVGVRGFARPGDYNTRILLLVDGHRINDPIYDQATLGAELIVDMDAVERVEVIRGPGSSLYGTEAFLAVINVITRTVSTADGVQVGIGAGSLGLWHTRSSVGHRFTNGAELLVTGSVSHADGNTDLYYPEFDTPLTHFGVAHNADEEQYQQVFGSLRYGPLTFRAAFNNRDKHVPTASYGTTFGDNSFTTKDRTGMAEAVYDGDVGRGWTGLFRASYDHYDYGGVYPYVDSEGERNPLMDSATVDWLTGEVTLNRHVGQRHRVTVGAAWRQSLRERQFGYDNTGIANDNRTATGTWGAYVQDEFTLLPHLVLNAGARLDHLARFGQEIAPRGALIYRPVHRTSFKLLHGRAFRAPNAYEYFYYSAQDLAPTLEPETVATTEGIWEQYFGQHLRSSVSVFRSRISGLITQQSLADNNFDDLYFANLSEAQATGVEGELEGRWGGGLLTRVSHTRVNANDLEASQRLSNSPQHLSKFAVIVPLGMRHASVAVEGQRLGSRLTLDREQLPAAMLTNITFVSDPQRRTQFSLSLRNAFDQHYSVPGAQEHAQHSIQQDGRTVRADFSFGF